MSPRRHVLAAFLALTACTSEPASSPTPATTEPPARDPSPAVAGAGSPTPPAIATSPPAVAEAAATPWVAPTVGQLIVAPARIVVRDPSRKVTIEEPARVQAFLAALGPAATATGVRRRCGDVYSFAFQDESGKELGRIGLCGAPTAAELGGAELAWQGGRGKLSGSADESALAKLMAEALAAVR